MKNSDLVKIKDRLTMDMTTGNVTNLTGKNKDYFIINGTNLPSSETVHGMLFCRYYDGHEFAPNSYQKAEPITKQIYMPYSNDNIYTRTYNHGTSTWTSWSKH